MVRLKKPLKPMKLEPVIELVKAATAARDTFDTLRNGRHFSGLAYEKGYERLRSALAYFNVEELERTFAQYRRVK